jgi:hypothetical protein
MSPRKAPPPPDQIEILLRTLRVERHFRRPLLVEVLDRLSGAGLVDAADAARHLLDALDHNASHFENASAFEKQVVGLERLVRARGSSEVAA